MLNGRLGMFVAQVCTCEYKKVRLKVIYYIYKDNKIKKNLK